MTAKHNGDLNDKKSGSANSEQLHAAIVHANFAFNPLPNMPISGSSNSAANNDMMS